VILVTGGSGYLGQTVVRRLAAQGHRLRLLVRRDLHVGEAPPGVDVCQAPLGDSAALERALEGCRQVVHLAALVRRWSPDPAEFKRVNVVGLANLLDAARRRGVEKILYTSSFLALGPTDGAVHDEDTPRRDPPAGNLYAASKRDAEEVARRAVEAGAPLITLYPGVLYGPGPRTEGNLLGQAVIRHLRGELPGLVGGGERRWCFAYLDDVVGGHLAALERARPGSRYILGGENLSLREAFGRVAAAAGVEPPRRAIPYWAAEWAGRWQVLRARCGGPPPEITPDEVEVYRHDWAYSSARSQADLAYAITPFSAGVEATLLWARAEIREMERGR
jgi:farnesol dehydrogenase